MGRRLPLLLPLLAALLLAAGCGRLLESDYYAVSDYGEESVSVGGESGGAIGRYSELRSAISELVENHEESGRLLFSGYEDSDLSGDLAQACWDISTNTPLGAYSVDYISYDLNQIVSYYEASVYINYRRSAEQTSGIISVNGTNDFREALAENLGGYSGYVVIAVNTATLTADYIKSYINELCLGDPVGFVVRPEVSVSVYPDSGLSRLYEISADFGYPEEELAGMSSALMQAANAAADVVGESDGEAMAAFLLAQRLAEGYSYNSAGGELTHTAWGALVGGEADSQGVAMAYAVLCGLRDIECQVVEGRLDNRTHFWNIVGLDGAYYHVDVTGWNGETGPAGVFLRRDDDLWERYWWDSGDYPDCEGPLDYFSLFPVSPAGETEEDDTLPDAPPA